MPVKQYNKENISFLNTVKLHRGLLKSYLTTTSYQVRSNQICLHLKSCRIIKCTVNMNCTSAQTFDWEGGSFKSKLNCNRIVKLVLIV